MGEAKPDLASIGRQLSAIERDLEKAIDRWEPPSAREAMIQLARVVMVLREAYPDPDEDLELYDGLTSR